MSYQTVDQAAKAIRVAGDLIGRVETALLKKAAVTINALTDAEDQKQRPAGLAIIDGSRPASWATMVVLIMDINGNNLSNPTDTQIDTAVTTAWSYIAKSR